MRSGGKPKLDVTVIKDFGYGIPGSSYTINTVKGGIYIVLICSPQDQSGSGSAITNAEIYKSFTNQAASSGNPQLSFFLFKATSDTAVISGINAASNRNRNGMALRIL